MSVSETYLHFAFAHCSYMVCVLTTKPVDAHRCDFCLHSNIVNLVFGGQSKKKPLSRKNVFSGSGGFWSIIKSMLMTSACPKSPPVSFYILINTSEPNLFCCWCLHLGHIPYVLIGTNMTQNPQTNYFLWNYSRPYKYVIAIVCNLWEMWVIKVAWVHLEFLLLKVQSTRFIRFSVKHTLSIIFSKAMETLHKTYMNMSGLEISFHGCWVDIVEVSWLILTYSLSHTKLTHT